MSMAGKAALDISWLAADLAIGGALAPGSAAALAREHGVGHVVDMREEACDDETALAAAGLAFLWLPVADHHAPTPDQLDAGAAFARTARAAGSRLLIHCQHGIGRSATLALCIMVDRGADPLAALTAAKDIRERVSPSLAQYEAWAAWLRRRAAWAEAPDFEAFRRIAYRHLALGA